ncbi:MAG TPA: hypothetical protein VH835_16680, partial [Dongiaceae bacterium]
MNHVRRRALPAKAAPAAKSMGWPAAQRPPERSARSKVNQLMNLAEIAPHLVPWPGDGMRRRGRARRLQLKVSRHAMPAWVQRRWADT